MRNFEINWLNILLGINLVIFVIMYFLSQNLRFESDFILIGALSTDAVFNGYPWLLVTSNFIHFNLIHFLFNAFSFFNLGRIVNEFYPKTTILIVYIFAGITGSLLTVIVAMLTNTPMISIGASGSIFGLAGFLIAGTLKKQRYGYGLPYTFRDLAFPIGMSFAIGFIPGLGVNNWAHLGGFLGGVLLGFLIKNDLGEIKGKNYRVLEKTLYYVSLFILIISFFLLLFNVVNMIFL